MSKKHSDPAKLAFRDLAERCGQFIHKLMADDKRHDRESLSGPVEGFLRNDEVLRAYANSIIASQVVDEFVKKTSSTKHFEDTDQLSLLSGEDEVREKIRHSTFEVGDGTVVRLSAVTFLDLERRNERKAKNRDAATVMFEKDALMLAALRPYMVEQGMTHEEAMVAVWHNLTGKD